MSNNAVQWERCSIWLSKSCRLIFPLILHDRTYLCKLSIWIICTGLGRWQRCSLSDACMRTDGVKVLMKKPVLLRDILDSVSLRMEVHSEETTILTLPLPNTSFCCFQLLLDTVSLGWAISIALRLSQALDWADASCYFRLSIDLIESAWATTNLSLTLHIALWAAQVNNHILQHFLVSDPSKPFVPAELCILPVHNIH